MTVNQLPGAGRQLSPLLFRLPLQIQLSIAFPLERRLGLGLATRFRLPGGFLIGDCLVFLALMLLLAHVGVQLFRLVRRRQPGFE